MNQSVELSPQKMAKINSEFIKQMQSVCLKKCLPDYKVEDLNSGEKNCIDRCVSKYYETNQFLTKLFAQDKFKPS